MAGLRVWAYVGAYTFIVLGVYSTFKVKAAGKIWTYKRAGLQVAVSVASAAIGYIIGNVLAICRCGIGRNRFWRRAIRPDRLY